MDEKLPQPRNIFEAINQNIYVLGENVKLLMDENAAMRREIAELRAMFNAPTPELPNAVPGSESAVTE